jgi:hypothetical protein
VPDKEVDSSVLLPEAPCELFGNGYGAVPSTCAADADGEVGLAFCGVARNEEGEEFAGFLQELLTIF